MVVISAPDTYSNPVVIVIPKTASTVGDDDTDVAIYYIENNDQKPIKIVNDDGGLIDSAVKLDAEMHVRGMATKQMPKQQFSVKLKDKPDSGHFLGMNGGGKHWIFNDCGAFDHALVRNILTFNAQQGLGQYAPEYKYFELFLCDNTADISNMQDILDKFYHGVYLNFDKIRFESSRIDLPYDKDNITGDYAIIQLNQFNDKYLQLPNITLTAEVEIYEPKLDDINDSTDPQSLKDAFNNWYNGSGSNWGGLFAEIYNNYNPDQLNVPETEWEKVRPLTNYESFAVYFLINELAKDEDGYHKSTFMVKNKEVCQAGPLWDKNKSYGNKDVIGTGNWYVQTDGWLFSYQGQSPVWWHVMPWDQQFCETVWNTWTNARKTGGVLTYDYLKNFIDTQVSYLADTGSLTRDSECWPSNTYNQPISKYYDQVTILKTYLEGRLTWIDQNLAAMLKAQSGYVAPVTQPQ